MRAKFVYKEREVDAGLRTEERSGLVEGLWWRGAGRPDQQNVRTRRRSRGEGQKRRERKNYKRTLGERSLLNLGAGIRAAETTERKPQNHSK